MSTPLTVSRISPPQIYPCDSPDVLLLPLQKNQAPVCHQVGEAMKVLLHLQQAFYHSSCFQHCLHIINTRTITPWAFRIQSLESFYPLPVASGLLSSLPGKVPAVLLPPVNMLLLSPPFSLSWSLIFYASFENPFLLFVYICVLVRCQKKCMCLTCHC